jgi:ATP-dependent RNA helicase DeaD
VPTGKDICAKQLFHLVEKIKETEVDEKELGQFLPVFEKELKNLSRQELLNRFISVEFNHFINLYKNNQDLEVVSANQYSDGREDKIKKDRLPDEEFVNIRLGLGKKDGFNVKTLFAMVNSLSELKGAAIGKIKLADSFTIFGIDRKKRSVVIDSFDSILYDNKSFETSFADEGGVDRTSRVFVKKPAGRSFNRRREERRGKKRR